MQPSYALIIHAPGPRMSNGSVFRTQTEELPLITTYHCLDLATPTPIKVVLGCPSISYHVIGVA
jgi:O-acetyl-ADP-ribose deacetylase (regulator of RNase III)